MTTSRLLARSVARCTYHHRQSSRYTNMRPPLPHQQCASAIARQQCASCTLLRYERRPWRQSAQSSCLHAWHACRSGALGVLCHLKHKETTLKFPHAKATQAGRPAKQSQWC